MTAGRTIIQRALGQIKLGKPEPLWFDVVARLFPPLDLTKPVSQGINLGEYEDKTKPDPIRTRFRSQKAKGLAMKRDAAIKHGRPPKLIYPEDVVRERFFKEHPAERTRPVSLNENLAGQVDSEFVVQRQVQLKETLKDDELAYQQALKEFYAAREQEEVEQVSSIRQGMQVAGQDPQQMLDEAFEKVNKEKERLAAIKSMREEILSK